jgi:hypothetical protein
MEGEGFVLALSFDASPKERLKPTCFAANVAIGTIPFYGNPKYDRHLLVKWKIGLKNYA